MMAYYVYILIDLKTLNQTCCILLHYYYYYYYVTRGLYILVEKLHYVVVLCHFVSSRFDVYFPFGFFSCLCCGAEEVFSARWWILCVLRERVWYWEWCVWLFISTAESIACFLLVICLSMIEALLLNSLPLEDRDSKGSLWRAILRMINTVL